MRAGPRAALVSLGLLACSARPIEAPPTPGRKVAADLAATGAQPSATRAVRESGLAERAQVYAQAHRAMRAGRNDEARAGFAKSVRMVPELADHALYHQAHLAREAGSADEARAAIERLFAEHPDSVWLGDAAVDRGRLALDAGAPDEAASWFERSRDASDPATAAAAKLGLAQAMVARGQLGQAYDLADGLRGKPGNVGSAARVLGESLEERGPAALGLEPGALRLRMARARLRESRPGEAREALEPLLREGQPQRAEASLLAARSYGKSAPADASAAYEVAIRSSTAPDVAGTALFERGKAAWNRNEDEPADTDFRVLLERFPGHPSAPEALAARARIAESRGDVAGAVTLYQQVAARYPDSRFADDSSWRAGFARYQSGDTAGAASTFAALGERDDARYWQARALEKSGDRAAARALFAALRDSAPASYVAWWVDERIGPPASRPSFPRAGEHGPPGPPAIPPTLGGVAAYHYSRGQVLASIGLRRDAVREYAAVEEVMGPDPLLLDAYRDAGAWNALVRTGIRLQQSGQTGVEDAVYPEPFVDQFSGGAARAGVDPLLLISMARQESLFDPEAVSSAGARGVLQMLPTTASRVAGQEVTPEALNDPSFNIDLAARYFNGLLQRFDGRIVLAVAAYNAGPEAVERWVVRSPDAAGDEFVERISYRETRDYVKAVLRNYRTYHLLYGDGDLPKPHLY
jgi:soluble lytic murein transglycosylase